MLNILESLIQRCIARNQQPRNAHHTRYTHNGYSIYYASRAGKLQSCNPRDFETARLGIIPIAKNGYPVEQYAASVGKDWKTRYGFDDWELKSWKQSYGVQVYTGEPSEFLTDFDFEFECVRDYPHQLIQTLAALCDLTPRPLITMSKSGGIRFSCRTPDYVHPRSTEDREYIGKWNQETGKREALYLEIFGEKGLSRWDARYEIITGDLFDLPVISDIDALFKIIDNLKSQIHVPAPPKQEKKSKQRHKKKHKRKRRHPDVEKIDGLPSDIEWIPTGETDKYKSRRGDYPCNLTVHTKSHGAMQYYKNTQTGETSGFCHNCRERQVIQEPTRHRTAPDRLHITGALPPTDDYEDTQADMKQQLRNWEETTRHKDGQHLLNIITPAQTGKTTVTITNAKKLTYITKTEEKATEAYNEAVRNGKDAYLHKSRLYNRDRPDWHTLPLGTDEESRPCIHPEPCNLIAAKGFSSVKEFCAVSCEQYATCKSVGFLSQVEKERWIDHVYYWQGEAFFADEIYQSRVQAVMQDRDAILAIDEPNPADLPQERILDTQALRHIFNNIKYTPAAADIAIFLKTILEKLSTAETPEEICTALSEATKNLSETDITNFDEKLSGIPVHFVWYRDAVARIYAKVIYNDEMRACYVADDDDEKVGTIPQSIIADGVKIDTLETRFIGLSLFERLGWIDLRQEAKAVPRVYQNLVRDIKRFVDSDSHACHRIDGSAFAFYLPPSLNARRGITLNASDTDNLIGEVYQGTDINVDVIVGNPPPWKPNNYLFQISTGRYPPGSLFETVDGKPVGLSNTMSNFLSILLTTAEKYRVLAIGPKHLQNPDIDGKIHSIVHHENITLDTHIGAQGKNEYQDRDVVFVFCFEPQPDIVEAQVKRIYRYQTDLYFDRELVDVVVDGVVLKDVMRYKDARVQRVYNLLCEKAHMQAILRLRQALNENKFAILFSAEPVSQIPVTPVPFRKEQLLAFMENPDWQLSQLAEYLEAEAERTPAEIAAAEGVSIRTAYYKSEQARKQTKDEKKAKAKALDNQKVPVTEIIAELNISKPTFYRWKTNKFE